MKKIFLSTAIFVLLLAASVFAFTKSGTTNSCPMQNAAQSTDIDYSNVVVARGDSCCQPGADCCKNGSCCKHKHK